MGRSVVLASASPRRRELLSAVGFDVRVSASNAPEDWPAGASLQNGVVAIAKRKLAAVDVGNRPGIAADTIVICGEEVLGKPRDKADAARMLRLLSGREHQVMTGFCVRSGAEERSGVVTTRVWFRSLTARELDRYIVEQEPYDKAGSYAIQGSGGVLVDRIEGSFTNVVGLPVKEVLESLAEVGCRL